MPWIQLIAVTAVLLTFFEKPLWCNEPETVVSVHRPCENPMYPSYPITYLELLGNLLIELGLFLPIALHSLLMWFAQGRAFFVGSQQMAWSPGADDEYFTCMRQRARMVLIILYVGDLLHGYLTPIYYFRFAPYLRIGFVVLYSNATRDRLRLVLRTLPDVLNIFALVICYIAFFSWLGVLVFPSGTAENEKFFDDMLAGMWSLYILMTTANFPDVMMPAYRENRLAVLFFLVFIMLGVFFLINLLTAVVFNAYKRQVDENKRQRRQRQSDNLKAAFELLCTEVPGAGHRAVTLETMRALFAELNHYQDIAYITEDDADRHFQQLDTSHDQMLSIDEFNALARELAIRFADDPRPPLVERVFKDLHKSPAWQSLKKAVNRDLFDAVIDTALAFNVALTVAETWGAICGESGGGFSAEGLWWSVAEIFFTLFYVCEACLKITVHGFDRYWMNLKNRFDFVVTITTTVVAVYVYIPNSVNSHSWIHYVQMIRLLRILRLLFLVNSFRVIVRTFVRMLPDAVAIIKVFLCVMYIFAVVGVQLFGGVINTDPTSPYSAKLASSDFGEADYYTNNFNDMPSAMVTLFELTVVNNWFVLADGFAITCGRWAYLYFVLVHLICVVICLNIVVAFILDIFIEEYELNLQCTSAEDIQFDLPKYEE